MWPDHRSRAQTTLFICLISMGFCCFFPPHPKFKRSSWAFHFPDKYSQLYRNDINFRWAKKIWPNLDLTFTVWCATAPVKFANCNLSSVHNPVFWTPPPTPSPAHPHKFKSSDQSFVIQYGHATPSPHHVFKYAKHTDLRYSTQTNSGLRYMDTHLLPNALRGQ